MSNFFSEWSMYVVVVVVVVVVAAPHKMHKFLYKITDI
jgi:Sec-independent protein translocase protein TatA